MRAYTPPRAIAANTSPASAPLRNPVVRRARAEQLAAWFAFATATVGAFALTLLSHA